VLNTFLYNKVMPYATVPAQLRLPLSFAQRPSKGVYTYKYIYMYRAQHLLIQLSAVYPTVPAGSSGPYPLLTALHM